MSYSAPRFSGTTVLVPEVATNYGALLADAFAEAGASLVLGSALDSTLLDHTAERAAARGAPVERVTWLASSEEHATPLVSRGFEAFGHLDVLISNLASLPSGTSIEDVPFDRWTQTLVSDIGGTMRLCQMVLPGMMEQRKGRIIVVIGGSGFDGGDITGSTTQLAMIGLVRGVAREFGRHNITANCVSVEGVIDPFDAAPRGAAQPAGALPREGSPAELAAAVLALADAANGFITGQCQVVNGGRIFI